MAVVLLVFVGHGRTTAFERKAGELRGQLLDMGTESEELRAQATKLSQEIMQLTSKVQETKRRAALAIKKHKVASGTLQDQMQTSSSHNEEARALLRDTESSIASSKKSLAATVAAAETAAEAQAKHTEMIKQRAHASLKLRAKKEADSEKNAKAAAAADAKAAADARAVADAKAAEAAPPVEEQADATLVDGSKMCGKDDIAFFRAMDCKEKGKVGMDCKTDFETALEYLPPPAQYLKQWNHQRKTSCNKAFGLAVQHRLRKDNKFATKWTFDGPKTGKEGTGTHSTVGKSILYPSGQFFWSFITGQALPHVEPDESAFMWTQGLEQCTGKHKGWMCLFDDVRDPLSDVDKSALSSVKLADGIVDEFFKLVISGKLAKDYGDSGPSMVAAGQIYQLYLKPAKPTYDYISKFLTRVKAAKSSDVSAHPSVSMHVRHGDACHTRRKVKNPRETTERGWYGLGGRPCYEPEVYMQELERLQKMYGVQRVYLATDSSQMIAAAQRDTRFDWVFLNASRAALDVQSGGTFIEQRLPGIIHTQGEEKRSKEQGTILTDDERYLASVGAAADVVLMSQGGGCFAPILAL